MDGRGDTNGPKDAPTIEADDAVDQRLGETVRLLRQRAGLSIQDVANKTGLSNGMISQLERAPRHAVDPHAAPAQHRARRADLLFLRDHRSRRRAALHRAQEQPPLLRLTASGVVKEALTPDGKGQLELYELTLNPGASSGTDFLQHTGEKAGYILSGSLRLWLDNQAHVLEAGDSFRFPSIVPHMFDNPTQQTARVIWVTTLRQTDRRRVEARGRPGLVSGTAGRPRHLKLPLDGNARNL
ncbi:cupin domain-containing protein [Bradyrhizobium diazoefficiens]